MFTSKKERIVSGIKSKSANLLDNSRKLVGDAQRSRGREISNDRGNSPFRREAPPVSERTKKLSQNAIALRTKGDYLGMLADRAGRYLDEKNANRITKVSRQIAKSIAKARR